MNVLKNNLLKLSIIALLIGSGFAFVSCEKADDVTGDEVVDNLPKITDYPIVGTNQTTFLDNSVYRFRNIYWR